MTPQKRAITELEFSTICESTKGSEDFIIQSNGNNWRVYNKRADKVVATLTYDEDGNPEAFLYPLK